MKTRIIKQLTTHIVQKKVIGHVVHPSRPSGDPFGGLSVPEEKLWLGRDNSWGINHAFCPSLSDGKMIPLQLTIC